MWGFNINCSALGLKGEEVEKQMSQAQPQYTISGQLGLGEGSNKPMAMPTKVTGMTGSILQLACGGAHTLCATSTGVWSWGLNDEGQLGRHENRFVPTPIRGLVGHKIKRVSCGAHHSAAISSNYNNTPPTTTTSLYLSYLSLSFSISISLSLSSFSLSLS